MDTTPGFTMTRHDRLLAARWLIAAVLLLATSLSWGAAGKVLFATGDVRVERNGAQPLRQGDAIEVGDVVVTGAQSRAQLLMADGAKIAMRAGSRLRIDGLTLPAAVTAPGQATAVAKDGSSIATLLKGGFRTSTGSIGKTDPAAYQVRTPVGVLGIRGTDYTAVFCQGDCADAPGVRAGEAIRDGLYLGVTLGRVAFAITGGAEILVEAGQFVLIPLAVPAPETLPGPPAFLLEDGAGRLEIGPAPAGASDVQGIPDLGTRRMPPESPTPPQPQGVPGTEPSIQQPIEGTDPQGRPVDITGGNLPAGRRDLAFAVGNLGQASAFTGVQENAPTDYGFDRAGNIDAFAAPFPAGATTVAASYDAGTATSTETGADASTQLRWGRWTGGQAGVLVAGAPQPIDLANRSLHWVLGGDSDTPPALPQGGTATYFLVGGTSPTDQLGNQGTLNAAGLDADFTNSIVTTTLDFTLGPAQWNAVGTGAIGAQAGLPAHQFGGTYNVTITGGQAPGGSGSFSGFFSAPGGNTGAPGLPGGAALSWSVFDDAGLQNVQGGAAFEEGSPP
jgi:hypothetical protein